MINNLAILVSIGAVFYVAISAGIRSRVGAQKERT